MRCRRQRLRALAALLVGAYVGAMLPLGSVRAAPVPPRATFVTRAAFAEMLAHMGQAPAGTVGPPFADVAASAPYHAAVEAVTGLDWMPPLTTDGYGPEARFGPGLPVDRLTAAVVAADYLGLDHVAVDEESAPLPYADGGSIPVSGRGDVVIASHLGLLPFAGARFDPGAPLTPGQARVFFTRLAAVTPAQVQALGAAVTTSIYLAPSVWAVEAGGRLTVEAFAHDAAGYIVPAAFRWSSDADGIVSDRPGETYGRAAVAIGIPGTATITASVVGGSASQSIGIAVEQAARLSVGRLPPAVLDSARLSIPVTILTAGGGTDQGANGFPVRVTATPAGGGGRPLAVSAVTAAGSATLTLPPLPPGAYTLRISAGAAPGAGTAPAPGAGAGTAGARTGGLAAVTRPLRALRAPIGGVVLRARGGRAEVGMGSTLTVVAGVYGAARGFPGAHWPLAVAVSGRAGGLPLLTGESAPPPTLALNVASADVPSAGGPAAVVSGTAPGTGQVTVSVPGGALSPATLTVQVAPSGLFGRGTTGGAVQAGQPATLRVSLLGPGGQPVQAAALGATVYLEPIDPAGHPLPYVPATVIHGVATASFTPEQAGTWTFRWRASGYPVASGAPLLVRPGPATHLVIDASPTSILLPGQRVAIQAWLADRFGNQVAAPFTLTGGLVGTGGGAGGGTEGGAGGGTVRGAAARAVVTDQGASGTRMAAHTTTSSAHAQVPSAAGTAGRDRADASARGAKAGGASGVTGSGRGSGQTASGGTGGAAARGALRFAASASASTGSGTAPGPADAASGSSGGSGHTAPALQGATGTGTLSGAAAGIGTGAGAAAGAGAGAGGTTPGGAPNGGASALGAAAGDAASGSAAGMAAPVGFGPAVMTPLGRLDFTPGGFGGPGVVGSFTAGPAPDHSASITETLAFRSPDHPGLGDATLTLRLVANPAARVAGKGLWVTFPDWKDETDAQLLQQAKADGATHIYLEVATSADGFYGGRALDNFLPEAHDAGIAVIAWIYPTLEQPGADTTLMKQVASYVTPTADRADGLGLDLEEVLTPSVVARYTAAADAAVGPGGLVVGITYPPQFRDGYPFQSMARYVQAFALMDYWHVFERDYSYSSVYQWVTDSIQLVRQRSKRPDVPVEVIAQTFDAFAGSGTGIFSPVPHELAAAVNAAASAGAIGVSFYRPATATSAELQVMADDPWHPQGSAG